MGRNKILHQPIRISDLSIEELYDDVGQGWEHRAEKLRAKRWRRIKQQLL